MLSFKKGKDIKAYEFWLSPFWLRVYNFPIELMACQAAIDVGNALGELIIIDWKDRFGGWTEFIKLKVKINVSKPLRKVVKLVDKEGVEIIGVIKYERLLEFCYVCGLIGHSIKTCKNKMDGVGLNEQNLQYESWLRAPTVNLNKERGLKRNGLELIKQKTQMNDDKEEIQTNLRDENGQPEYKGKERSCEEESLSISPIDRRNQKTMRDGMGRFKSKRKRHRGQNGKNLEESPARIVKRRIFENVSPVKAMASDQPHQEP
ncbi:hypothetical protein Gotur_018736 [Gossypium turneri]